MAQITLSARIDSEDKKKFDKFCDDIGLSTSALLNVFVKKVIREQRIPFTIESDPFYSEENIAFIRKGIAELNASHGTPHELIEEDVDE